MEGCFRRNAHWLNGTRHYISIWWEDPQRQQWGIEGNELAHLCMEQSWRTQLLFCIASHNSDMGNWMQLSSYHFLKLELSEAVILATKPTGILPHRPKVTHLWVFSMTKGMEYMTSHMVSHFTKGHLLSTKETRNPVFTGKFLLGDKTPWEVFNNNVSLLLWSWYGNESELLIVGRSSTFPIIFSVSGSSDSQSESRTAWRSVDANFHVG